MTRLELHATEFGSSYGVAHPERNCTTVGGARQAEWGEEVWGVWQESYHERGQLIQTGSGQVQGSSGCVTIH